MRVAIAGATGLLGRWLRARLEDAGQTVVPISCRPLPGGVRWDPASGQLDPDSLQGCDVVVNLAGARIAPARWTEWYKREIRESRVLRRPSFLRVPAFAVRLVFGREMAEEVLLSGQRAVPRRLLEAGFTFRHPELEGALRWALRVAG